MKEDVVREPGRYLPWRRVPTTQDGSHADAGVVLTAGEKGRDIQGARVDGRRLQRLARRDGMRHAGRPRLQPQRDGSVATDA